MRGAVQPRRAGVERRDRVRRRRSRDRGGRASRSPRRRRSPRRPRDEPARPRGAGRRRVADGVGDADARAPARMAVEYSCRSVSGSARVVSSVTYIAGSPSRTANVIASSVSFSSWSSVQPSAYCRSGLEPMNVQHSIGMPDALRDLGDRPDVRDHRPCRAVRPDLQALVDDLARQSLDVAHHVRAGPGQADVRRVDAEPVDQVEDLELLLDRRTRAPTATAARRAASRRRASPRGGCGASARFQS